MAMKQLIETPVSTFDSNELNILLAQRSTLVSDLHKWQSELQTAQDELLALDSSTDSPMEVARERRQLKDDAALLTDAIRVQEKAISALAAPIQEQIAVNDAEYYAHRESLATQQSDAADSLLTPGNKAFDGVMASVLALYWLRGFTLDSAIDEFRAAIRRAGDDLDSRKAAAISLGIYSEEVERPEAVANAIELVGHPDKTSSLAS